MTYTTEVYDVLCWHFFKNDQNDFVRYAIEYLRHIGYSERNLEVVEDLAMSNVGVNRSSWA
jgi:hypothetical protein